MRQAFRALTPYLAALAVALAFAAPAAAQDAATAPAAQAAMKDLPLTVEQRQGFVATYTLNTPDGAMPFRIFEQNGALHGQPGDDEPKRLQYQGENVFMPEGMPEFTLTFTMEGQRATKFVVKSPEFTLEGVRMP
jgi:hypothetical protein